jgi:Tfp pilus assembly protein FimT
MFTHRDFQGLTLMELIIVLAVTVIITLVSIPSFVSIIQKHRVKGIAESFYYDLQYARAEAIKLNSSVYVSFTTGDSWCYGIKAGSACDCTTAGSCTLKTVSASASQLNSLSQTGYGSGNIIFEGSHGGANASGSITFTIYSQSNLMTVSIGRMGFLQMCSTGIAGYTGC